MRTCAAGQAAWGTIQGAGEAAKIGSDYYDATILQRDCTTAEALLSGQASQRGLPGAQGCSTPLLVAHLQPIDVAGALAALPGSDERRGCVCERTS